ncbi:MAG: CBS domain-containing protein [Gammaproteobacteria bacterium]|nr:CBS domain-containing protein [Gammaproteobacteria bacterium]NNM00580.1 CBS domain-containing protein [Gammaproteobacteria bacterium]
MAAVPKQLVRDWMTPSAITVGPAQPLGDAQGLMEELAIRRLAVVDNDKLVGILSLGDVLAAHSSVDGAMPETVAEAMTPHPVTITEDASIGLAAQTLLSLKVSGLPVVNESGTLSGVLSESDLFRYIVSLS